MHITSRISAVLLALFTVAAVAHAQQTRTAYIDASKLLKRMPEVKDASARLDQLTVSWTKEASDMQGDIDRKQAEYDRRKLILTDAERSTTEQEITNLHKKHDDFLHAKFDETGGELFTQEATLMKPAYDKLSAAIKECAEDGNYDYVIDRSSKDVVLLYVNSKFDLTLPVARKLGIESEILSTPLVNAAKPGTPGTPPNGQQPQTPGSTPPGSTTTGTGIQIPGTPQNPATGTGLTPNNGTSTNQPAPGTNSGFTPVQIPTPLPKQPAPGH